MKILHISHHIGCMRDHAYIYHTLGAEYEFWKFPKGIFHITKILSQTIWNQRREYFNRFDYIITSDTAPLSRIFMEHIHELTPTIIVWICNRFDYNMERDPSFYQIFNKMAVEHQKKFKIIPYSDFEGIWCKARGIHHFLPTISPIGVNQRNLDVYIDGLQELEASYTKDSNATQMYNSPVELQNKMFIPIYGNDNNFFNLKAIFQENGIDYFNGGYKHPTDLQYCNAVVTFPDAIPKLITFETIQNEIIVFLPSEEFLIKLHPTKNNNTNYWFNCPFGHLNHELIKFCEWYRYTECRIYFDSIADLIHKVHTLSPETIQEKKSWCRYYGKIIEENNMNLWKQIIV